MLYDGHSTHVTTEIIETARESNVHLFVLPSHGSHMLQSLDVSVFGPFKKYFNSEINHYLHNHPKSIITRQQLPNLPSSAYRSSMTITNIMAGFGKTGIFSFNPDIGTVQPPALELPVEKNSTK